jgi:Domain of unknown function (DUF4382)/Domain of unknown function (DUF5666)
MRKLLALVFLIITAALLDGCSTGSGSNGGGGGSNTGSVFLVGEDAPYPSVVAFNITINSIMLNNGSTSVEALAQPTTVDFGRLMGLRSLLAFNTIARGTYTSATFTLSKPSISYVDMTVSPPSSQTLSGTLTNAKVTVAFPANAPLVVSNNNLAGLHMDFDLAKSLTISGSGISVNPVIYIQAVSASDDLGKITEFVGSVLTVGSGSFNLQGPWGFQETIDVNAQTQFNAGNSLTTITGDSIVAVQGTLQADGSILASNVEVINTDSAFISGRVLAVTGTTVTMFVAEELPNMSPTVPIDTVYTVDLSAISSANYKVCFFANGLTQLLFNSSSMVMGQRIFVGGTFQNNVFTPALVSLRLQGVWGAFVPGSVVPGSNPPNEGSFEMKNNELMSLAYGGVGQPFPVNTFNPTVFLNINGLSGLSSAGATNLVTVGLVFEDQTTKKPVVYAGLVAVRP